MRSIAPNPLYPTKIFPLRQVQSPVVQTMDKAIGFGYPLDGDLSGGQHYPSSSGLNVIHLSNYLDFVKRKSIAAVSSPTKQYRAIPRYGHYIQILKLTF